MTTISLNEKRNVEGTFRSTNVLSTNLKVFFPLETYRFSPHYASLKYGAFTSNYGIIATVL